MSEITQKQLEANRENSKFGGVKTDDGKAISKMNALKHGLLSSQVLIEAEKNEKENLADLSVRINEQLLPMGEFEVFLTDRIISNIWRLKRLLKIESSLMEFGNNEMVLILQDDIQQANRTQITNMLRNELFERIMRYEANIERGIFKSLHELQRLQAIRKGEKIAAPIALDIDLTEKN